MNSESPRTGILFILSGPSGVGKDAVLHRVLTGDGTAAGPGELEKCVTATSRAPRAGEVDGVDYHFWDEATFTEQLRSGGLLESAVVHNHHYGTPRAWVEQRRARGIDVVLKIDVQGARMVKEKCPDAVMIFLLPPSLQELERRLRQRLTDSEEQIRKRQEDAHAELGQARLYDYLVVNDRLEEAVRQVESIIIAERCRTARQAPRHATLWEELQHGQTPV